MMFDFFKKKKDPYFKYSSTRDLLLRLICLFLVVRGRDMNDYNADTDVIYKAESLRNYLRFGRPYGPWWKDEQ